MTTDIERQFFETFNIKRREYAHCCSMGCTNPNTDCDNCEYHEVYKSDYPEITDRILLELIVIIMFHEDLYGFPRNVKDLKEDVLRQLMETYNEFYNCVTCDGEYQQTAKQIKQQIQALFKEI